MSGLHFTEEEYQAMINSRDGPQPLREFGGEATQPAMNVAQAKQIVEVGQSITIKRSNKLNANIVVYHCEERGVIVFDSSMEHRRYLELRLLERAGEISNLKLQPPFALPNTSKIYKADFVYHEDGKVIVEDVKGHETATFKLKWSQVTNMEEYAHIEWRKIT